MADNSDAPTPGKTTAGKTTAGKTTADQERYEEARRRVGAKKGLYASLLVYVVMNVVFLFVAGWDWLWVTLFWGFGLAVHAWHVFGRHSEWMQGWEQRQMEKELARDKPPESV
ncbi:MAG: 2TM domain-containing protein [Acidimicrobiia bacterium]|nr:2TM domain-containing protein [Acidimicrobiia bacterium]